MTDLRKADQEALECLEGLTGSKFYSDRSVAIVIASLRAALAAPDPAAPLDALRALPPEPSEEAVLAANREFIPRRALNEVKRALRAAYAIDCCPAAPDGWQPIETAPKNGTPVIGAELYRFLPYKPDGVRQMKTLGRWQRWNGYGWDNSTAPESWIPAAIHKEGEKP